MALLVGACGGGDDEVPLDTSSRVEVVQLVFDHPQDLEFVSDRDGSARYCLQSEQDTRTPRCLEFSATGQVADDVQYEELDLTSGGVLRYYTESAAVGSGPPEYWVRGYIELGGDPVFVQSHGFDRPGVNGETWALPIFQSIRR